MQSTPPPVHGLGIFEVLPYDLLHHLLLQLSIFDLMTLRLVNRRAAHLVRSFPQVTAITRFAVETLHAIESVGVVDSPPCAHLYEVLCTRDCATCGKFGGYLDISTLKRACFLCFEDGVLNASYTNGFSRPQSSRRVEFENRMRRVAEADEGEGAAFNRGDTEPDESNVVARRRFHTVACSLSRDDPVMIAYLPWLNRCTNQVQTGSWTTEYTFCRSRPTSSAST